MANRSAARLWGEAIEAVTSTTDHVATLRAVWNLHRGYDFSVCQAELSDVAIARLKEALGAAEVEREFE